MVIFMFFFLVYRNKNENVLFVDSAFMQAKFKTFFFMWFIILYAEYFMIYILLYEIVVKYLIYK